MRRRLINPIADNRPTNIEAKNAIIIPSSEAGGWVVVVDDEVVELVALEVGGVVVTDEAVTVTVYIYKKLGIKPGIIKKLVY